MDRQTYLKELEKAYRDERMGQVIATTLLEKSGSAWPNSDILRQMAALEQATAEVLHPLILQYGLDDPDPELIRQEGVSAAQSTASWIDLTALLQTLLPPIVKTFEGMLEVCDQRDFSRIDFLLRHEQALLDLVRASDERELTAASQALGDLIEERNQFSDH